MWEQDEDECPDGGMKRRKTLDVEAVQRKYHNIDQFGTFMRINLHSSLV